MGWADHLRLCIDAHHSAELRERHVRRHRAVALAGPDHRRLAVLAQVHHTAA